LAGREIRITFTPHLLPVNRGILSTIYASLAKDTEAGDILAAYRTFYRDEPFVRVFPAGNFPNVSSVRGSNYCDIGVAVDKRTRRAIVVAAIDNLIKGASGQAVQNMNLMCGFPEATGLDFCPLFP
jgi:N-acetyl-gamma-glutamyl-phosphate reductase